jgi:hypothetical protein
VAESSEKGCFGNDDDDDDDDDGDDGCNNRTQIT